MLFDLTRTVKVFFFVVVTTLPSVLASCGAFAEAATEHHPGNVERCMCQCWQCTDPSVPEGEPCPITALEPYVAPNELFFCIDESVSEGEKNAACQNKCGQKLDAENMPYGSACARSASMEIETGGNHTCEPVPEDHISFLHGDPPYTMLRIDEDLSKIKLKINGDSGSNNLRGKFGFTGGNCPATTCQIEFQLATLTAPDFEVDGIWPIHIDKFFAVTLAVAGGTVYPDGGFQIEQQLSALVRLNAWKSLVFDKDISFIWRTHEPLAGKLNFDTKQFDGSAYFEEDMDEGHVEAEIRLVATWDNLAPLAGARVDSTTVECDAPGTGTVILRGVASDSDGWVVATRWVVDRQIVSEELETEQHLKLGDHEVTLFVKDNEGAYAQDTIRVAVVDTTPPVLGPVQVGLYCAAPPNHKYVRLELGDEVMANVTDICDPYPVVSLDNAWSDQPENGIGDGNTTNDVILFPEAVCLRSERSGTGDERCYTVMISAEDSSGNRCAGGFSVRVVHDQRDHDCRPLPPSTFISYQDASLICPPPEPAAVENISEDTGGGCSVIPRSTIGSFLFLFLILGFLFSLKARRV